MIVGHRPSSVWISAAVRPSLRYATLPGRGRRTLHRDRTGRDRSGSRRRWRRVEMRVATVLASAYRDHRRIQIGEDTHRGARTASSAVLIPSMLATVDADHADLAVLRDRRGSSSPKNATSRPSGDTYRRGVLTGVLRQRRISPSPIGGDTYSRSRGVAIPGVVALALVTTADESGNQRSRSAGALLTASHCVACPCHRRRRRRCAGGGRRSSPRR